MLGGPIDLARCIACVRPCSRNAPAGLQNINALGMRKRNLTHAEEGVVAGEVGEAEDLRRQRGHQAPVCT